MIEIECSCDYCGHQWEIDIYVKGQISDLRCPKCKDTNVSTKQKENKIDYYQK